jgi:alcohol dehydrogenase
MVDFSIYNRDDDSLADIDYMGHGRDGGYAEYMACRPRMPMSSRPI